MDRRDPLEMNGNFVIVLHHFNSGWSMTICLPLSLGRPYTTSRCRRRSFSTSAREPPANERGAQSVRALSWQVTSNIFFQPPKRREAVFIARAANADRLFGFLARKGIELPPILIAMGKMRQEVVNRGQPKAFELAHLQRRQPTHLAQRRIQTRKTALGRRAGFFSAIGSFGCGVTPLKMVGMPSGD